MFTFYPVFSHSLWVRAPDVPSLICKSFLTIEHQFLQGESFSGKIRASRRSEFRDCLMKSKIFLTQSYLYGKHMTPGRSWCGPWKGGLATYIGWPHSALVISTWMIGSVFGPTEFCCPLPPAPPISECNLQGGPGGQGPPKYWDFSFYLQNIRLT